MKLIENKPIRLFTFGCSFTGYRWPTWANIVAYDLDVPLYNYGKNGAGNQYMFNMLMQADNHYNINENDLVMISWTNVMREDRWFDGEWKTPGNIFTQSLYSEDFVEKYANETHACLRDFAYIKAAYEILKSKKCQFHFLKMINFEEICQWGTRKGSINDQLYQQYERYLNLINPSFFSVLWENKIYVKQALNTRIHPKFNDGHPTILEHLSYLKKVFDEHEFSQKTEDIVNEKHEQFILLVKELIDKNVNVRYHNFTEELNIKKSEPVKRI